MTSWEGRPDISPIGQAISWRQGLLLSVVVHVATILVLLLWPRVFPDDPAAALVSARPAAVEAARAHDPSATPEQEQLENREGGVRRPPVSAVLELTGNHLWQSTLCLAGAALLTLVLRRNRARVRYAIWVAASVKFLVPFAPLIVLARQFSWRPSGTVAEPAMTALMNAMSQPLSRPSAAIATAALPATSSSDVASVFPLLLLAIWLSGSVVILLRWCMGWRHLTNVVRRASPIRHGHELDVLRQLEARAGMTTLTRMVSSDATPVPGVFGVMTPVLLWPRGIAEHLTVAQTEAVIAHEVSHIRRRDNLAAAVHMFVEALFWFHPLIWWLETRLVHERERACDEEVVQWGHEPVVYAESILKTCQFYAESGLTLVAGVSRADLKRRIEAIMSNQNGEALGAWRKLLLSTAAILTLAAPIVMGLLSAPLLRAQSPPGTASGLAFEAASVKPNRSGGPGRGGMNSEPGGRLTGTDVTAAELIRFAYELPDFLIFGGPEWLNADHFVVEAKAEGNPTLTQKRSMLRRLLADRFKLTTHTEMRDLPFYALVMARSDGRVGPQLRRAEADCAGVDRASLDLGVGLSPSNGPGRCGFFGFAPGTDFPSGRGGLAFRGLTMAGVAKIFVPMLHRSVADQTGLAGYFDGQFDFIAELPLPPPPPGMPNPFGREFVSVFTVLPEQLGLKLDARRGPVEVLVIDRVERPTPN